MKFVTFTYIPPKSTLWYTLGTIAICLMYLYCMWFSYTYVHNYLNPHIVVSLFLVQSGFKVNKATRIFILTFIFNFVKNLSLLGLWSLHITANGMGTSDCITLISNVLILTWVCTYFNLQTYKIFTDEYILYLLTIQVFSMYFNWLHYTLTWPWTHKQRNLIKIIPSCVNCENAFIMNLRTNNELNSHSLTTRIILNWSLHFIPCLINLAFYSLQFSKDSYILGENLDYFLVKGKRSNFYNAFIDHFLFIVSY